jgi:hypothetical protein
VELVWKLPCFPLRQPTWWIRARKCHQLAGKYNIKLPSRSLSVCHCYRYTELRFDNFSDQVHCPKSTHVISSQHQVPKSIRESQAGNSRGCLTAYFKAVACQIASLYYLLCLPLHSKCIILDCYTRRYWKFVINLSFQVDVCIWIELAILGSNTWLYKSSV